MPISYKEIAEIIKIIDASDCDELVVELDGARLEVRRHGKDSQARAAYSDQETEAEGNAAAFASKAAAGPSTAVRAATGPASQAGDAGLSDIRVAVRSPMVGTFYRAPSPQEPPFVEVGDSVKAGDRLCLIEVMKLYTTIVADIAGRIVEVAADNAVLVEHDQILFIIEPE